MRSVWIVFCGCGFHAVCPLIDEVWRLVEASWWEGLVVGKTVSCSGGRAMLSKSLINFFCFNPVLLCFKVKYLYKIICFVLMKLTFTGKWNICTQEVGQLKHKMLLEPVSSYVNKLRLESYNMKVSCSVISNCVWPPWTVACQAPLSMESSSKNTGVGCYFLPQGIFPAQELNLSLLHCKQILY